VTRVWVLTAPTRAVDVDAQQRPPLITADALLEHCEIDRAGVKRPAEVDLGVVERYVLDAAWSDPVRGRAIRPDRLAARTSSSGRCVGRSIVFGVVFRPVLLLAVSICGAQPVAKLASRTELSQQSSELGLTSLLGLASVLLPIRGECVATGPTGRELVAAVGPKVGDEA
jgi:hypothetical protein